jgi:hypothetical protein
MPGQSTDTIRVTQLVSPRFSYTLDCRPAARTTELQTQLIQTVKANLVDGLYGLRHYDCPCGSRLLDIIIAEVDRYGLPLQTVLCQGCGSLRFDPYLDDASLAHFYSSCYQQMYGRAVDVERYFTASNSMAARFPKHLKTRCLGNHWSSRSVVVLGVPCRFSATMGMKSPVVSTIRTSWNLRAASVAKNCTMAR